VHVILIADFSKMGNSASIDKMTLSYADAGHISQNIYLFVASEGLATGIRHWIDKKTMAKKLKLKPTQEIILAHSVGYKMAEP
jgi:nitroreductase